MEQTTEGKRARRADKLFPRRPLLRRSTSYFLNSAFSRAEAAWLMDERSITPEVAQDLATVFYARRVPQATAGLNCLTRVASVEMPSFSCGLIQESRGDLGRSSLGRPLRFTLNPHSYTGTQRCRRHLHRSHAQSRGQRIAPAHPMRRALMSA